MREQQWNIKPLHAEVWICTCVYFDKRKCHSSKNDHQQKYRCSKNSRMWFRHREKDIQKWEGSHWLGPCRWDFAGFILIAVGFYGQTSGLGMTRLDFKFQKTTVAPVWKMVWETGVRALETSTVILERYCGCLNMGRCSGVEWIWQILRRAKGWELMDWKWREDIVWDGTQVSGLDTSVGGRYKHRDGAFGRRWFQ